MRLLVTGGAGFIGSEFVRQLMSGRLRTELAPDCWNTDPELQVTVLDSLSYSGVRENLEDLEGTPGYRFVHGDIRDTALVGEVMDGQEAVVHFAAETHVDRSIKEAAPFVTTNVLGTHVLLEAARAHRVRRFLHVSTDEVYGSIDEGSWGTDQPLSPNSPYAASKAASDLLALSFHRTFGMDVVVTRCSNNYGPRQFPEKVIPLFVTRLLEGLPVPLYGDGSHVRDWLHVSDHCRGIALALSRGRAGEVYHFGGGRELSNLELAAELVRLTGARPDLIRRVSDRRGHDLRYSLDIGRSRRELGYEPRVPFGRGLCDTVSWYRDSRSWWEPLTNRVEECAGAVG
ncbi:dTDP-glucose 4,6-dehydratase [Streptomyces sp. NPDC005955]|uniref:dTDP-glucose 4,6-dehydratase n=1 Tax=Streptomyces sp. NPDC005955 TaxID=3364738 RepID=UPI0036820406